eukprot:9542992-Prorocentrum_lima.AAC.1
MLKRWPNKELIHILPFHPMTRCLRTGFKDEDEGFCLVVIDMMKFLNSEFSSYVYVTNSGVVLSASPIPPQFLICAT